LRRMLRLRSRMTVRPFLYSSRSSKLGLYKHADRHPRLAAGACGKGAQTHRRCHPVTDTVTRVLLQGPAERAHKGGPKEGRGW